MSQTLYAIDNSGSTSDCREYWKRVRNVVNNSKKGDKFILWNTESILVNKEEIIYCCDKLYGDRGTKPQSIVKYLNNVSKLVLVSDGQIYTDDVRHTDNLLKNVKSLNDVEAHFVYTGGNIDSSVVIPFSRNSKYKIYVDNNDVIEGDNINFDLTPFYEPEYYEKNYSKLRQYVAMKTLSREDGTLRNELLKLKNKLIDKLTNNKENSKQDKVLEMINKNLKKAYKLTRKLISSENLSASKKIELEIMELCNLCKSSDFSFDNIKSSRLTRANFASEPEKIEELKADGNYECPIILTEDVPCLLINKGEPLLKYEENVDDLITQPLYFLKREHLVEKLHSRLDSIIGVSSLSKLDPFISPFTRNELLGGLSMGSHESHLKSNIWTLARLFFGRKICGSVDLWMSVIYLAIKNVERFKEFVPMFENYLKQRFDKTYTTISLSGLPDFPLEKVKFKLAFWYVVSSPIIMKHDIKQDRLRGLMGVEDCLMDLLDLTGLNYEKDFLKKRVDYYKCFAWMLRRSNNGPDK